MPAISDEFVESMFRSIYARDLASDRFKALSEAEQVELTERGRTSVRDDLERVAARIEAKDTGLSDSGTLLPHNRFYRELFATMTGKTLPRGVKASKEAVIDWLGRERIEAERKAREELREAADTKRRELLAASEAASCEKIAQRIARGESVSGEELIDISRHLGHEPHPRTVGTLRRRIGSVKADQATYRGKAKPPAAVYELYRLCQSLIHEKAPR